MVAKRKTNKKTITKRKTSKVVDVRKEQLPKRMTTSPKSLQKTGKKGSKSKYVVLLVFLMLLGAVIYLSKGVFVAAMVNGKPIWRISVIRDTEKQLGSQSLDNLIMKSLVEQEANKKSIKVTAADIQEEISALSQAMEAQGTTLESALMAQGVTQEELEENMKLKRMVDELFDESIDLSEENLKGFFEENITYYGEDQNYEDLKDKIKEDYKNQEVSKKFQEWAASIKEISSIHYFVNY